MARLYELSSLEEINIEREKLKKRIGVQERTLKREIEQITKSWSRVYGLTSGVVKVVRTISSRLDVVLMVIGFFRRIFRKKRK